MVISLHQVDVALAYCPRTIALAAGRIVYDGPSRELTLPLLQQIYGAEAHETLTVSRDSEGHTEDAAAAAPVNVLRDLAALSSARLT